MVKNESSMVEIEERCVKLRLTVVVFQKKTQNLLLH